MAKLIVLSLCAVLAGVLAEPPSSYLPPQARNSLSSVYGAPNGGFRSNGNGNGNGKASSFHSQRTGSQSFSYNSLHENQFNGQKKSFGSGKSFNGNGGLSQQYGAPSQQYGPPGQFYRAPGQNGFGGRNGNGFGVSQQYGAPSNGFGGSTGFNPSQQYGAPNFEGSSNGFGLSQQYIAPGIGASGSGYKSLNGNGFGTSANGFKSSGNGFGVSQQYGAPGFSAKSRFGNGNGKAGNGNGSSFGAPSPVYGVPSSKYGAPGGGYGYSKMDDDLSEPANYEYTYEVQAAEDSGAQFGHQESREDEAAKGVYHVLLPDGRTQIVEYEADEEGFRPVIRYEEPTGYPDARGAQGPY